MENTTLKRTSIATQKEEREPIVIRVYIEGECERLPTNEIIHVWEGTMKT